MKKGSKLLSALTSLAVAAAILTGALAVPILWRGFYYGQIEALALPARTGFSPDIIREAFDQVMDYLLLNAPFGTGQLKWSPEGMAHFADCKFWFQADLVIFAVTALFLLILLVWALRSPRFAGRFAFSPIKGGVILLLVLLLGLGLWGLLDFESLFVAFHTLFFPGKTNWIFDARADQIILILPEDFWARAAALVAGLAFLFSFLLLLGEKLRKRRQPRPTVYEELKALRR